MQISGMVLCGKYEPYLKYCIESIKDICDEIVLFTHPMCGLDLPTDLNCHVLVQKDEPTNFAKWRNRVLDKTKGDWVLMLDADEVLAFSNGAPVDRKEVEKMIELQPDKKFFNFKTHHFLYNYFTLDGTNKGEHWSLRLFKNDGIRFRRAVHEYLPLKNQKDQIGVSNPMIWHFGHCKGMEDIRNKYKKTGKIKENPYGTRKDNDKFCATHDLFRGTRPMIKYNGPLPKVMKLW